MSKAKPERTPIAPEGQPKPAPQFEEGVQELLAGVTYALSVSARLNARMRWPRDYRHEAEQYCFVDETSHTPDTQAERRPYRGEAALRAVGWRFVPVPRF